MGKAAATASPTTTITTTVTTTTTTSTVPITPAIPPLLDPSLPFYDRFITHGLLSSRLQREIAIMTGQARHHLRAALLQCALGSQEARQRRVYGCVRVGSVLRPAHRAAGRIRNRPLQKQRRRRR